MIETTEFKAIKTITLIVYPYGTALIRLQVLDGSNVVAEAIDSEDKVEEAKIKMADWIRDNYAMLDDFVNDSLIYD